MTDNSHVPDTQPRWRQLQLGTERSLTAVLPSPLPEEPIPFVPYNQLGLLIEINAALAEVADGDAVLGQVLARLCDRAGVSHGEIYCLEEDRRLCRVASVPADAADQSRFEPLAAPTPAAWVAREATALYLPADIRDPRFPGPRASPLAEYLVPLRAGERILGVLHLAAARGIRAVTRKLVDQVALQISVAIERRELFRQRAAAEARFRSLFEQGRLGVSYWNLRHELLTANAAFVHLLGYGPGELRGRTQADLVHPEDLPTCEEASKQIIKGRVAELTLPMRYLRKSGETVWTQTTVTLLRDSAQRPAGLVTLVEDIRERKSLEAEGARLREQLIRAQRMEALGRLAGGIVHDFNNLLGVILGFTSLLRTGLPPGDPMHGHVRMIEQSGERAADLIRQLSGFTRQEQQPPQPQLPDEVLRRVVKITTQTFDRRIRVETRSQPDLPWVVAQSGELEQMILNLCLNARDAMPEGGQLTLEASRVWLNAEDPLRPAHCNPGEYVRLAVQDTGVGIAPQVINRVFEPFFTTKDAGKGSGLGLAMVYAMVTNQGGFVRAESEVGCGSRFTLYLPALSKPREETPEAPRACGMARGSGTILVVDDEPMVLAFAVQGLRKLGYGVLTADTGSRALEIYAARASEIDCVILDLILPEISGPEVLRRLRTINPRARVILSTGQTNATLLRDAREAGAVDCISKPYTLERLAMAIQRNLPP